MIPARDTNKTLSFCGTCREKRASDKRAKPGHESLPCSCHKNPISCERPVWGINKRKGVRTFHLPSN